MPPSSRTSIASVATGPLKYSFQCLYFAGSVRKSTVIGAPPSAMLRVSPLTQDDPERLGALGPEVFPAVGRAAVEHVEELHLAWANDDLVGLRALGARAERRDHGSDLALEEPRAEHVPLLRGPVEGDHGVFALPAHVA